MSRDASAVLAMQGVWKSYASARGPVAVLKSVDLRVDPGEFVAITGPSGSGKTTLLNLAGLLDAPSGGRVFFCGQDVSSMDETRLGAIRARSIGRVFQSFCLLPRRSVLENVLFRFRYLDVPRAEALNMARRAIDQVGLAAHADQSVRLLSGGEMQRVAIARAMALPPALLLVDEPTGNLDGEAAGAVMAHFRRLNSQGMTIVLVTHNRALLGGCGRRLACVDGVLGEDSRPAPAE